MRIASPNLEKTMNTTTHVWVVESLFDDTPTLLSVHINVASAHAARAAYMADYRNGGTESDYRVRAVEINK